MMAGEMIYFALLYIRYWLRAELIKEWRMLLYASLIAEPNHLCGSKSTVDLTTEWLGWTLACYGHFCSYQSM